MFFRTKYELEKVSNINVEYEQQLQNRSLPIFNVCVKDLHTTLIHRLPLKEHTEMLLTIRSPTGHNLYRGQASTDVTFNYHILGDYRGSSIEFAAGLPGNSIKSNHPSHD